MPRIFRQIVDTLVTLKGENASMGDPWELGDVLRPTRQALGQTAPAMNVYFYAGQRVSWTRAAHNNFVITESGLLGAVWATSLKDVADYLTYRERTGWIGRTADFPDRDRIRYRAVEVGLLAFQHAAFEPPIAEVRFGTRIRAAEISLIDSLVKEVSGGGSADGVVLESFRVGRYDLNHDGSLEIFVQFPWQYCGTVGCETRVYRRAGNEWQQIGYFSSGNSMRVMHESIEGHHSFYSSEEVVRWVANGSEPGYVPICVAWKCWNELGQYLDE